MKSSAIRIRLSPVRPEPQHFQLARKPVAGLDKYASGYRNSSIVEGVDVGSGGMRLICVISRRMVFRLVSMVG